MQPWASEARAVRHMHLGLVTHTRQVPADRPKRAGQVRHMHLGLVTHTRQVPADRPKRAGTSWRPACAHQCRVHEQGACTLLAASSTARAQLISEAPPPAQVGSGCIHIHRWGRLAAGRACSAPAAWREDRHALSCADVHGRRHSLEHA